jgi:hypothetical protein
MSAPDHRPVLLPRAWTVPGFVLTAAEEPISVDWDEQEAVWTIVPSSHPVPPDAAEWDTNAWVAACFHAVIERLPEVGPWLAAAREAAASGDHVVIEAVR